MAERSDRRRDKADNTDVLPKEPLQRLAPDARISMMARSFTHSTAERAMTLPLWMYERTSLRPACSNAARSGAISTLFLPVGVTPRNSTTYVFIIEEWQKSPGA